MSRRPSPPKIKILPEWREARLPFNIGSGRTLYAGLESDNRLRLRVFRSTVDDSLVGRVWFGDGADGPPMHAHGGAVAYILDEAMGAIAWMGGHPVVAARLEFQYSLPTPLYVDLHLFARVKAATKRRVTVETELRLPGGGICVSGRGEFARLTLNKIESFMSALGKKERAAFAAFERAHPLKWASDDAN